MFEGYLLSVLVWLPIIGGLIVLFTGDRIAPRALALAISGITFLISLSLWTGFNSSGYQMQFVESTPWIESFNINYHLAVDGISSPVHGCILDNGRHH